MNDGFSAIFAFIVLIIMVIVFINLYSNTTNKENERRFDNGEMTENERAEFIAKKIKRAEELYFHGDLTLLELEAIKKKYSGHSIFLDYGGLEFTRAYSNKKQVENAITQHKKDAENSLILSAAIGDAIGGTAGAIVGASASIQKSANDAATLEAMKLAAERDYQKACENYVKYGKQ